jgi:hypothetical protein
VQKFRIAASISTCPSSNKKHTQIQLRLLEWTKKWIERHRERHRIVRFPLENYAGILGYEEKDSAYCKKWRESYYYYSSIWALKKAQLDYYVCCWVLIRLRCLLASKRKELCKQFGKPANGASVKLLSFSLLRAHPLQLLWFPRPRRDRDCLNVLCPVTEICTLTKRCGFGRGLETLQRRLPAQASSRWWWCTWLHWFEMKFVALVSPFTAS